MPTSAPALGRDDLQLQPPLSGVLSTARPATPAPAAAPALTDPAGASDSGGGAAIAQLQRTVAHLLQVSSVEWQGQVRAAADRQLAVLAAMAACCTGEVWDALTAPVAEASLTFARTWTPRRGLNPLGWLRRSAPLPPVPVKLLAARVGLHRHSAAWDTIYLLGISAAGEWCHASVNCQHFTHVDCGKQLEGDAALAHLARESESLSFTAWRAWTPERPWPGEGLSVARALAVLEQQLADVHAHQTALLARFGPGATPVAATLQHAAGDPVAPARSPLG